jgi:hypothetical protein
VGFFLFYWNLRIGHLRISHLRTNPSNFSILFSRFCP